MQWPFYIPYFLYNKLKSHQGTLYPQSPFTFQGDNKEWSRKWASNRFFCNSLFVHWTKLIFFIFRKYHCLISDLQQYLVSMANNDHEQNCEFVFCSNRKKISQSHWLTEKKKKELKKLNYFWIHCAVLKAEAWVLSLLFLIAWFLSASFLSEE